MKKNPLLINSMNYGAITGLAIILLTIVIYLANLYFVFDKYEQLLSVIIMVAAMAYGTIQFRKNNPESDLRYGKAFLSCFLIGIFTSILLAFYNYLFFEFIDPSMLDKIYVETENRLMSMGKFTDEEIERMMEMQKMFMTPKAILVFSFLGMTFWSFILSLIVALFVRDRNKKNFNRQNE